MNTSIRSTECTPLLLGLTTPLKNWSYGEKQDYHYDSVTQTTYYMGGNDTFSKKSRFDGFTRLQNDRDKIQEESDD
jgi:hypothetical protein